MPARMKKITSMFHGKRPPSVCPKVELSGPFPASEDAKPQQANLLEANQQHLRQQEVAAEKPAQREPYSFALKVERDLWPPLDLDACAENNRRLATERAQNQRVGPRLGGSLFTASSPEGAQQLPPLLFDQVSCRVVKSAELGKVTYAAISHVWGPTVNIDGLRYGVSWDIPVQSEEKLVQILEAARIVVGERYVWMDILCLDQRLRNESEIAQMKSYFENASGCFVWLDNTFDDPGWDSVLDAIEAMNAMDQRDRYGSPIQEAGEGLSHVDNLANLILNDEDCIGWVGRMKALGNVPWFKRVWTLQEGIIPNSVHFCTPERYMFSGTCMWHLSAVMATVATSLIRNEGAMLGTSLAHELQRCEIHKMLRLRQAYRGGTMSYWHLAQAVRTRHCKFEQDRVLGVLGLVQQAMPAAISYHRTVDELYHDLYRAHVSGGDFEACMFLGGRVQHPDLHRSVGVMLPQSHPRQESHTLALAADGLHLNNVGYDYVTRLHCLVGTGSMAKWPAHFSHILEWPAERQCELARAFKTCDSVHPRTNLCPGALAVYTAFTGRNRSPKIMPELDELWGAVQKSEPVALLEWIRVGNLLVQDLSFDSAVVMIVTQGRNAQLAVLTEQVEDVSSLITLMPSSYGFDPGAGCIVARLLPSGDLKKIGVGFGTKLRHSGVARFTLVD